MKINIFQNGEPQDIGDVLKNKDHRQVIQNKLKNDFPDKTIIAIKLNIPGPIKNNSEIEKMFDLGYDRFLESLANTKILEREELNSKSGKEVFLVLNGKGVDIERISIKFEDESELGRLFDIDVMDKDHGHYSRKEFKLDPRQCFICSKNAKECARNRTHSVRDLQDKINRIYLKEVVND